MTDRTYFRMLSDSALMEAARYCDNDLALVLGERLEELWHVEDELETANDLALVLGERLEELGHVEDELETAKEEIKELDAKWTRWMDEAIHLHEQLDALRGTK